MNLSGARAEMPSTGDISSAHVGYFLEKAEEAAGRAEGSINDAKFISGAFSLKDVEFFVNTAVEFAVPPDHPVVTYFRDRIAAARAKIQDFGGGESAQEAAEQWWQRVYFDQAEGRAYWVMTHANDTYSGRMAYYFPRYWANVLLPKVAEFKQKYPTAEALVALVPQVDDSRRHWDGSANELPLYDWTVGVVEAADQKLPERLQATMPDVVTECKKALMDLEGKNIAEMIPGEVEMAVKQARTVIDNAKVVLSYDRENADAEKMRAKGEKLLAQLHEKESEWEFHIEDVRMPEDVNPGDAALHAELKAAYEAWAQANGYDEQVLRVVLTGDWTESFDAWWVGNVLHWGTFRRIPAALAIKNPDGCMVMYCVFYRKLLAGDQWQATKLERVVSSEGILEENINQ
jgi:hypothetical protein